LSLILKADRRSQRRARSFLPRLRRGGCLRVECKLLRGRAMNRIELRDRIELWWHCRGFSRFNAVLPIGSLALTLQAMSSHNRIALAFMAHPDDAEILCAGTLIRLRQLEWEIHIATLTAGDCGSMTERPEQIMKKRLTEARTAAALIGATYHCLDERDGLVVYDKSTIRKAIELFRAIGPSLVFTHPLRDYMMDHEAVAQLARGASFLACAPNASATPLRPGVA